MSDPKNSVPELNANLFMSGFAAALVTMDVYVIFPYHECDLQGFGNIYKFLCERSEAAKSDEAWYRQLIRLRVMASPGIVGWFDTFVYHLRGLQNSSAELPNTSTIRIVAPRVDAEETLRALSDRHRVIVLGAAQAFINGRVY